MVDQKKKDSMTAFAVIAVITAALVLRFVGLDSSALTLNEAENALAAMDLFDGASSHQLLYALPTAFLFKMFGVSDFTARLFPALCGTLLAVLPLLFRKKLGTRQALLLAFVFALDPVLLFWSKRADSLVPAVFMISAAAASYAAEKGMLSVFFCLAALGAGARFAPVLLAVPAVLTNRKDLIPSLAGLRRSFGNRRTVIGSAALFGILILCFGTFPMGIGSYGSGIADVFRLAASWEQPGIWAILAAMIIYCGIPLLVFLQRCVRGDIYRNPLVLLLCFAGMLLWKGIPALVWINWTLWLCTADFIFPGILKKLEGPVDFPFCTAAAAVMASYAFFYFRLVEVFNQQNGSQLVQITFNGSLQTLPLTRVGASALLTLVSLLILVLIVRILFGFFDSVPIRRGLLCGFLIIAGWGLAQNLWNCGGFDRIGDHPAARHPKNSANLLNGSYTSFTDKALFEHLDETAVKHGDEPNPDYALNYITDDPLLDWALISRKGIRNENNTAADLSRIDMILAPVEKDFTDYGFVGTVFTYRSKMNWDQYSIQDWGKWLLFGDEAHADSFRAALWVRGDMIFSEGE